MYKIKPENERMNKIDSINLCYPVVKHSAWLNFLEEPIRILKIGVA